MDKFIVTNLENNCVKVFDKSGQFLYKFGEKGNGNEQLNQPWLMCWQTRQRFLIATMLGDRILFIDFKGKEVYILKWKPIFESNIQ